MKGQRNPDRQIVKVTLLIAGIMTILGGPAMSPALPSIRDHFSNVQNIEYLARFVLTLPALMIAGTALIAGYLVDHFAAHVLNLPPDPEQVAQTPEGG